MGGHTTLFVTVGYLCGGVATLVLAVVAFRNRETASVVPFGLASVAASGWSFSAAAMFLVGIVPSWLVVIDPATARAITGVLAVISSKQIGPLLLVFAIVYTGRSELLTRWRLAALFAVPGLYSGLLLTAPLHGLVGAPVTLETVGGITAPVIQTDLGFQLTLAYSYLTILALFFLLWSFLLRPRNVYRTQTAALFLGTALPALANVGFRIGFSPHPGFDLTPFSFVLTGVILGWALFQNDFFDASPLAGDLLIDELPDPVLVLNDADEIIDANPAAVSLIRTADQYPVPLSSEFPGLLDHLDGDPLYSIETADPDGTPRTHHYRPRTSPIEDHRRDVCGRLVVLRDMTDQQSRQDQLEALQTATQQFISSTTSQQVATRCVEYAEHSLGQETVMLFLPEDGGDALELAAMSDIVHAACPEMELQLTAADDDPVWRAYETGTKQVIDHDWIFDVPFELLHCYPLGEQGVLVVGTQDGETQYQSVESQFIGVLAQTTQVALSQINRERELRESRTTLERRNDQIEFFNDVLWHTLRNALLVVQGRASHLRSVVDEPEQVHIDSIQKWCDDLEELSEKIRAVNETVTASESRQLDPVDLTGLLEERIAILEANYDISIQLDTSDEVVLANHLAADVVDNVVRNAIIHNDRKHPSIQIWTQRAADRVQLSIADDGPGMSREMKTIVFEQDLSARQTAEGFGLYFVSVMMNLYGGNVWFENNQPRGTIAVLEFQHTDEEPRHCEPKGTSLMD